MRKAFFLLAVALCGSMAVRAQQNPVKGYIITNTGDTIRGTIDYQTRGKMARACHFQREGETSYATYQPGQIAGFRMMDDGVYFVTRRFPVDGELQTIFAEYLVQGGMSLYRYEDTWTNAQFYLVDSDGKVALVKDPGDLSAYSAEDAKKKHDETLLPAMDMLKKSDKALKQLQNGTITANKLLTITRDYNNEYCQEDGDCVVFQYNAKRSSTSTPHFRVQAGYMLARHQLKDADAKNFAIPRVGLGCDFEFKRVRPGFSLQTMLLFSLWEWPESGSGVMDNLYLVLNVGPSYVFHPEKRVSPFVRGGLINMYAFMPFGLYAGGGVDFKVGKQHLRAGINADYFKFLGFLRPDDQHGYTSVSLDLDILF